METRPIPQRFTKAMCSDVVEAYVAGASISELARAYNTHRKGVSAILDEYGVQKRAIGQKRKFNAITASEMIARYKQGETGTSIANAYNTTRNTVLQIVRDHGIDVRNRGNTYREFSEEEKAELARLWESGVARHALAEQFDASMPRIAHALALMGYEVESRLRKGEGSPLWKGGRTYAHGYVCVRLPPGDPYFPMCDVNGYIREHRWVMAQSLGRLLTNDEQVHHLDGDKANNRLANLQLHVGNHGKGRVMVCADCGSHNVVPRAI